MGCKYWCAEGVRVETEWKFWEHGLDRPTVNFSLSLAITEVKEYVLRMLMCHMIWLGE